MNSIHIQPRIAMSIVRALAWGCAIIGLLGLSSVQPASAALEQGKPITLRPDWHAGQQATYRAWNKRVQRITGSVDDKPSHNMKITTIETSEVTWKVDEVHSDGSSDNALTIKWVAITVTDPKGKTHTVDTRKELPADAGAMGEALKAMTGVALHVTMDAAGKVTRVTGMDAMPQVHGQPAMTDEQAVEIASGLVCLRFNPASATIGQVWHGRYTTPLGKAHLSYETDYTLASVDRPAGIPVATVTAKSRVGLRLPDEAKRNGAQVQLTTGTAESQIMIDLSRHEVVGQNATRHLVIQTDLTIPNTQHVIHQTSDETAQGQVLRVKQK